MYINTNSKDHKKDQIITSKKSFDVLSDKLQKTDIEPLIFNILDPAIRAKDNTLIESIPNEIRRIWEYATLVSIEPPFKVILFTSKNRVQAYKQLQTTDNVKDEIISIKDESNAQEIINNYVNMCKEDKSL
jgi:hypothetical protein